MAAPVKKKRASRPATKQDLRDNNPEIVDSFNKRMGPIDGVTLLQLTSSHCIEGMHTMPWPELHFELVE